MPKGKPNKRYTPEFKIMVVETMHKEGLSHREAEKTFELPHRRAAEWLCVKKNYVETESNVLKSRTDVFD